MTLPEAAPRPVRATCCGLLPALSVKFNVAVRVPDVVGLKMILAVQLAEAASVEPQVVLKTAKSPALVPVKPMLSMVMALLPELVSVATFCPPALPTATVFQLIEVGDTVAVPPEAAAVPERATVTGVEPAVMLQVAVSMPEVVGLKSTEAVQLADAAREEPQVVDVTAKSAASVPVIPAALRVTEFPVLFVRVIV